MILGGGHGAAAGVRHRSGTAARGSVAGATGARPAAGEVAAVKEAPDPEEAKSFPAPATVHHAAAIKPSAAAEEVAPGAPSDAEVRAELNRMHGGTGGARRKRPPRPPSRGD